MNEAELLKTMDYYITEIENKNKRYGTIVKIGNIIKIVLSASIPIMITRAEENTSILFYVSISSAIITIIQSSISFLDYDDRKHITADILIRLKKERLLYITKTNPYNKTDEENFHLLVENFQDIVNSNLKELLNSDGD
ncbi:DUF4231 domain-containing protein [Peptostreptococcus faecalis]|uniref:DUF4231 domain-containing protein n=1 Tax=Peptostreptococcus faecalis TaxID=2045015 RepID=UPI000C7B8376|nr:DUF4231 domain-containing protein [Peptostreptococcus faecalis]